MSVRVVRVRSGEDVICDIREIHAKEGEQQLLGFQLINPYVVWISSGMTAEDDDGNIHKISNPEVTMEPWMPLAKDKTIIIRMDEVVSAYETHDQILEKYTQLVEVTTANGQDSTAEAWDSE